MDKKRLILPINPTIQDLLNAVIWNIYPEEDVGDRPKVDGEDFIAVYDKTVFDMANRPQDINVNRINRALMHHYIVEVIYFVPGNIPTKDARIQFRYIADYVDVLRSKNLSDLVRLVNEARIRIENETRRKTARKASPPSANLQLAACTARSKKTDSR